MEYVYGIDFGTVIMSIVIGITISMFLYERRGILTGGIITPAIFSLFITKIFFILSSILMVILLNFLITQLRKRTILYGRRLYSVTLVIGISIVLLSGVIMNFIHMFGYGLYYDEIQGELILPLLTIQIPLSLIVNLGLGMHYYGYTIGLILIPIIVNDTQTQGLSKTIRYLLFVAVSTFLIVSTILYFK